MERCLIPTLTRLQDRLRVMWLKLVSCPKMGLSGQTLPSAESLGTTLLAPNDQEGGRWNRREALHMQPRGRWTRLLLHQSSPTCTTALGGHPTSQISLQNYLPRLEPQFQVRTGLEIGHTALYCRAQQVAEHQKELVKLTAHKIVLGEFLRFPRRLPPPK